MSKDFTDFLARYPGYGPPEKIDTLRASEYGRLDATGQTYLDYTGGSLYGESQLRRHLNFMAAGVFGNPHSANRASAAMTEHVERARAAVLKYFNASPGEYVAAFTQNASGALKLIGEAFPFASGSRCLLTFDNHNSVNGIREFARAKGASTEYAPLTTPELRLDRPGLDALLDRPGANENLFAFPAQSNFTGVKHPLDLVAHARSKGWRVLLDAAAFVPGSRLDISAVQPDFAVFSFYKMFGYPTGVGALLVRREMLSRLRRPWFSGGTVNFATVQARAHVLVPNEGAFEDGTVNYLSIPAVQFGLEFLDAVGVESIGARVTSITGWLIERLVSMQHSNGRPMVRIYGPITTQQRGGTVTMNFYDPAGHLLDFRRVEELANLEGISLRIGCFCNPGAGEIAEGLTEEDMLLGVAQGDSITMQGFLRLMRERGSGKSMGAIRVSFGIASNFEDARRFAEFAVRFRDQAQLTIGEVTFDIDSCRVIRDGS
jgi:molybdenum cofactor sulfurtransferase